MRVACETLSDYRWRGERIGARTWSVFVQTSRQSVSISVDLLEANPNKCNMVKSKRNKIVHLTKVKKKGKDHKEDLIKQLNDLVDEFSHVYVFDFDNVKADRIMHLRVKVKKHGRIFAGRNSLVTVTLKQMAAKTKYNYEDLISQVVGHRGLLFANIERDALIAFLDNECAEFKPRLVGHAHLKPPKVVAKQADKKQKKQQQRIEFVAETNA